MRLVYIVIVLLKVLFVWGNNGSVSQRNKRYIIFPSGASYKLVIGVSIPLDLPPMQSLGWVLNMQFIHSQISNLTQIAGGLPPTFPIRRRRQSSDNEAADRAFAYMALESIMNKHGINGRECLLRTICENAMYNLEHDVNGLYGQLLNIIFTPEYNDEVGTTDLDETYRDARKAGEYGVDCLSLYTGCPLGHGVLDMISVLQ